MNEYEIGKEFEVDDVVVIDSIHSRAHNCIGIVERVYKRRVLGPTSSGHSIVINSIWRRMARVRIQDKKFRSGWYALYCTTDELRKADSSEEFLYYTHGSDVLLKEEKCK
jgi:hypothetical protein